jgi:hypothetical protein
MLGKNEVPNHAELQSYLHDGGQDLDPHKLAWCAAFVSASLQKAGLPVPTQVVKGSAVGPGAYAPNYLSYGSAVDPKNVQAGDILVANNGTHVGFAEGPIRQGPNGPEVQLLAGNEKDQSGQYAPGSYTSPTGAVANRAQVGMVGERWVPLSQYSARRYEPTDSQGAAPAAPSSPAPVGTTINSTATPPSGINLGNLSAAIRQQESSGNYTAVNRRSGALGAYQVMPFNLPEWGRAAGYEGITPTQFLANPKAQDDIANAQLKNYAAKYGNVGDVATAWYGGEKAVGNPNISGGKGYPTTGGYASQLVDKYNALGTGPIDPSIIARGGVSPPIPDAAPDASATPAIAGTTLPGFPDKASSDNFTKGATALDKAWHGDQSPGQDGGQAAAFNFPQARNVSPLLPMSSQIYGNTLTSMMTPTQWSSATPGQNPYAAAGGQPIGGAFGTQLGTMQQMQQMMAMMGNPYGDAGYG